MKEGRVKEMKNIKLSIIQLPLSYILPFTKNTDKSHKNIQFIGARKRATVNSRPT